MRLTLTHHRDEEGDDVDDAQRKACLQHRACLVDIVVEVAPTRCDSSAQIPAILMRNASQHHDSSDEGTDETQINEGYEQSVMSCAEVADDGEEYPCEG